MRRRGDELLATVVAVVVEPEYETDGEDGGSTEDDIGRAGTRDYGPKPNQRRGVGVEAGRQDNALPASAVVDRARHCSRRSLSWTTRAACMRTIGGKSSIRTAAVPPKWARNAAVVARYLRWNPRMTATARVACPVRATWAVMWSCSV